MASAHTLPLAIDRVIRNSMFDVPDPGASGTFSVTNKGIGIVKVDTATAESRAMPGVSSVEVGHILVVIFDEDGGDLTITGADQSVVLRDAGDMVVFICGRSRSGATVTKNWRVLADSRQQSALFGEKTFDIPIADNWRIADDIRTVLPAADDGTDQLGLVGGTFLTDAPSLNVTDATPSGEVYSARDPQVRVPFDYKAGTNLTLKITVAETVAADTATIDARVVRRAAPSVDINATAAQTVVGAAGEKSFTLTGTNVVPGEILDVVMDLTLTADTETPNYSITKVAITYQAG